MYAQEHGNFHAGSGKIRLFLHYYTFFRRGFQVVLKEKPQGFLKKKNNCPQKKNAALSFVRRTKDGKVEAGKGSPVSRRKNTQKRTLFSICCTDVFYPKIRSCFANKSQGSPPLIPRVLPENARKNIRPGKLPEHRLFGFVLQKGKTAHKRKKGLAKKSFQSTDLTENLPYNESKTRKNPDFR